MMSKARVSKENELTNKKIILLNIKFLIKINFRKRMGKKKLTY